MNWYFQQNRNRYFSIEYYIKISHSLTHIQYISHYLYSIIGYVDVSIVNGKHDTSTYPNNWWYMVYSPILLMIHQNDVYIKIFIYDTSIFINDTSKWPYIHIYIYIHSTHQNDRYILMVSMSYVHLMGDISSTWGDHGNSEIFSSRESWKSTTQLWN